MNDDFDVGIPAPADRAVPPVGGGTNDPAYDHDNVCDECGHPKGQIRTESVDGRGPGWKCLNCRWWNWLPAALASPEART